MSNAQIRKTVRIVHLAVAIFMAVLIYSPLRLDNTFVAIVQFIVVPFAVISGIILWQQPRVVKFFNYSRGRSS